MNINPFPERAIIDDSDTEEVTPQKIDYKSKDLELFNKWNASKSKKDMSELVKHLNPIIHKSVAGVAGSVPTSALAAEGKLWTIKAIKTFDPSKGFALSTHVMNYIKRIKRVNYKYQNSVRLPEHMQTEYHLWNSAKQQLSDELNEEPTLEHLSKRLNWPMAKVKRFNDRIYSDLIESASENPTQVTEYSDNNLMMNHILSNLTEDEQFILKNKGKMSATELSNKLGVDTNRLNYLSRKLRDKIFNMKMELGI